MQPDNPIVGGTILRRPAIQSPDFQTGVQGWALNADGSSEFNNTKVRGELDIGVSPNPRLAITGTVPAPLATWAAANSVTISELMILWWNATDFKWWATGTFVGQNCVFVGTYDTTNSVYVLERTLVTGAGAIETRYGSYALNGFQEIWTTQQIKLRIGDGSNIGDAFVCNGTAVSKAIAFNANGLGTAETWQPLSGLYKAGWADFGGGFVAGQYRHVASPADAVQIIGVLQTTAPTTTIATLPAGYRPVSRQRVPCYAFGGSMSIVAETPAFDVTTAGDLVPLATANAGVLAFNNFFQLDV